MIDLETYSNRINISVSEIKIKSRKRELVTARQVYWFYLHSFGYGFSEISRMFGWDYSTIIYSIQKIENLIIANDRYLKRYLEAIEYK